MNAKLRVERFFRKAFAPAAPTAVDAADVGTAFGMELSIDADWTPDLTHKAREVAPEPPDSPNTAHRRQKRD